MSNSDPIAASSTDNTSQQTEQSESIIVGQIISKTTLVSLTYTSLLMSIGRISESDADDLIMPFVEMSVEGRPSGSSDELEFDDATPPTELFSHILPLDNAAYVLSDIAGDMSEVCRQFRLVSSGGIRPEMKRLEATRNFLSQAQSHLEKCISELDRINQPSK